MTDSTGITNPVALDDLLEDDVPVDVDHEATPRQRRSPRQWQARAGKKAARWWYRRLRSRRMKRRLARLMWDAPTTMPTFTSTRQAAALDPLLTNTRVPTFGHLYGTDLLTHQPLTGSVQALYDAGFITAPMVAIIGGIGTWKSSTVKSFYGDRALATGTRVAVFDRKIQREGEALGGEYTRLARVFADDAQVVALHRDRAIGTRINILDPAISPETSETGVGQDELLRMVAVAAMGRELTPEEGYALAAAHRAAIVEAQAQGRVAILPDVIRALYVPHEPSIPGPRTDAKPVLSERGVVDEARVTEWGLPVALGFERFMKGDLSGIIDGETAGPDGQSVDLMAQLLVIDTSALPEGSEALALMMAIISTYLMSRWAKVPGFKYLVLEEAYSADNLGAVPKIIRALVKRSRGVGAAVIAVFHHISDVTPGSALYSLIKEAGIIHIFQQDKSEDAAEAVAMFDLPADMVDTIQTLAPGMNVWKRGRLPATIARAFRTPLEAWITDTDEAMRRS